MRKNYIDEIALVDQQQAMILANAPFQQIKAYVDQYNERISALTGQPIPQLQPFGNQGMMNPMQGMVSGMPGQPQYIPQQHVHPNS